MTGQLRELAARLRNLFQTGEFRRRYDDGAIQVQTHNNRVVEKKEAFPYGFCAKAKNGRALVVCQGGDVGSFEILPLLPSDDVMPPDLEDGDVALYTGKGARIVLREAGWMEIAAAGVGDVAAVAKSGKFYIGNDLTNLSEVLLGMIDEIMELITSGSPTAQAISPASKARLELYKNTIKKLLKERA